MPDSGAVLLSHKIPYELNSIISEVQALKLIERISFAEEWGEAEIGVDPSCI